MIVHYMDKLLSAKTNAQVITIEGITEELVLGVADKTEGFSGTITIMNDYDY